MVKEKIQHLLEQMNSGLVERETIIKTALLAVLAGENILLVGPPGTAKSLIARQVAKGLPREKNGCDYFEYLLTKFSTPEEIFGPLSIAELKADRFKRNTAAYLPTAKIAFLDEIFKASSSILNALLSILNERIYHNGADPQHVPLQSLIAASNELPTDQEELSALYDRFLVRSFVDYVSEGALHKLFDNTELCDLKPLGLEELQRAKEAAKSVEIPANIRAAIQTIWVKHTALFKEDSREGLSDRRLKKIQNLLRMSAATNGRSEVDLSDVMLLKDCLWNHQENSAKVLTLIKDTVRSYSRTIPSTEATTPVQNDIESDTAPITSQSGRVIKGLQGSGTAHDPFIIDSVQTLGRINGSAEVAEQGYYFRQTADIDCEDLTHWEERPFKGYYEGAGYTIKFKITSSSTAAATWPFQIPSPTVSGVVSDSLSCLRAYPVVTDIY